MVARAARSLRDTGSRVTMSALIELTTAGTGCGTCRPYLARVALTGAHVLPVMSKAESEAWVNRLDERETITLPL